MEDIPKACLFDCIECLKCSNKFSTFKSNFGIFKQFFKKGNNVYKMSLVSIEFSSMDWCPVGSFQRTRVTLANDVY